MLRERFADDATLLARFHRECRTMLRLRHDHIVATYDYGHTAQGERYLVMELLHGETVAERCDRGPMAWDEVRDVMRSVSLALGEIHARGILHRDLTPRNVHLGVDGTVKVLDFGLARYPHGAELTRVGHVVGSLPYLSPEQLCGHPCDARSDLYALGIVAYEMLTGTLPFEAAWSTEGLAAAMLGERPVAPSELRADGVVPQALEAIVMRCLEPARDARFGSARELADALMVQ